MLTHLNGQFIYDLCHEIATIGGFMTLVLIGMRRKYEIHNWILIIASGFVFLTIGMHAATISIDDLQNILATGTIPKALGKTAIGGIPGFLLGAWIAQKMLKTNYPVLDILAYVIPIGLFVQRIGCFFVGCCFGLPTQGIFGVKYAAHFSAYESHMLNGFIPPGNESSLAVHPVQLYFALVHLTALLGVFLWRRHFRRPGSLFAFSVSIMVLGRFFIEFLSDPVTNHQLGGMWLGIKVVQWVLIGFFLCSLIYIFFNEKRPAKHHISTENNGFLVQVYLGIGMVLLLIPFMMWFNQTTRYNLIIVMSLTLLSVVFALISKRVYIKPEFGIAMIPLLMIISMSQKVEKKQKEKPSILYEYTEHEIGGAFGEYKSTEEEYTPGNGCAAPPQYIRTEEHRSTNTFGYAFNKAIIRNNGITTRWAGGINYANIQMIAYNRDNPGTIQTEKSLASIGVSFEYGMENKEFGFRVGVMAGDMYHLSEPSPLSGNPSIRKPSIRKTNFVPRAKLFWRPMNKYHIELIAGDDPVFGLYQYYAKARLGLNLNMGNPLGNPQLFSIGYTSRKQISFEGDFSIGDRFSLRPAAHFGLSGMEDYYDEPIFALRLAYRPGFDRRQAHRYMFSDK